MTVLKSVAAINTPIDPDESYEGYIEINPDSEVVDAAFSSDGTAIAIATANGYVKFFQVITLLHRIECFHVCLIFLF